MEIPEQYVCERHENLLMIRRSTLASSRVLAALEQHRGRHVLATLLKEGKRSSVARLSFPDGESQEFACGKHYPLPTWRSRISTFLATSRAMRSFRTAHRFQTLGIRTAMPLALIERRSGGVLRESFLLMEDLSFLPGMPEYLTREFSPPLSKEAWRKKEQFIKDFAHYIQELHRKGVYQSDFKTTNVFVKELSEGRREFYLIDLDQVKICRKVSTRRIIQNLCQINTSLPAVITLADRVRFYRFFWGKTSLTAQDRSLMTRLIRMSWKRNPQWHPRFGLDAARIREWQ